MYALPVAAYASHAGTTMGVVDAVRVGVGVSELVGVCEGVAELVGVCVGVVELERVDGGVAELVGVCEGVADDDGVPVDDTGVLVGDTPVMRREQGRATPLVEYAAAPADWPSPLSPQHASAPPSDRAHV